MRAMRMVMVAVAVSMGQAGPKGDAPAVEKTLPAGWAPGLDKEVAGIKPLMMNLWTGEAPNQVKDAKAERDDGTGRIWDVNVPGMLVYLPAPEKAKAAGGTCIIECMGGSYTHLTRLVGGDNTVEPLTKKGIAVVSLKYRLKPPSTDPERDAVLDLARAIRLVRLHAGEWGIDREKVGLLGWSAGANAILSLSSRMASLPEEHSCALHPQVLQREDGQCPICGLPLQKASSNGIHARPNFVVMWSPWPNGKTADAYRVSGDAPPALLSTAADDRTAPLAFAKGIQANWEKAGVSITFVDVATGGHGAYGLGTGSAGNWVDERLLPWLAKNHWWKGP